MTTNISKSLLLIFSVAMCLVLYYKVKVLETKIEIQSDQLVSMNDRLVDAEYKLNLGGN